MTKPKFQLKIDRNNRCKVYLNKKWQKGIVKLDFHGEPQDYTIIIEKYKRDKRGHLIITEDCQVEMLKETYHIGKEEE